MPDPQNPNPQNPSHDLYRGGDVKPVPDPTMLTTEVLNRLEGTLRNLIAIEVGHIEELFDQKLTSVRVQFDMLEARTAEQKADTKGALDAALAAQKEAVANQTEASEKSITKSETSTIERIKSVETLLVTSSKATDDKISDIKERVVAIEAIKLGASEAGITARSVVSDTRAGRDSIIAMVGLFAIVAIPLLVFLASHFR